MILKLIRKDYVLSWTMPLWMAGSLALNVVIQAFEQTLPTFSLVFGSVIAGFLPVMISGREDRYHTNAFTCSLPVRRSQIVLARYLVGVALYPAWVLCCALMT
jgi:ABC-type transport system involved in multi-copper enzyme maturation permease subunit